MSLKAEFLCEQRHHVLVLDVGRATTTPVVCPQFTLGVACATNLHRVGKGSKS